MFLSAIGSGHRQIQNKTTTVAALPNHKNRLFRLCLSVTISTIQLPHATKQEHQYTAQSTWIDRALITSDNWLQNTNNHNKLSNVLIHILKVEYHAECEISFEIFRTLWQLNTTTQMNKTWKMTNYICLWWNHIEILSLAKWLNGYFRWLI